MRDIWLAMNFAATIFVSAFLLFQVQPLVSKYILPWFGGTPAVWTTCMLFFQTLLFGGYAYAHFSQSWLRPKHASGGAFGIDCGCAVDCCAWCRATLGSRRTVRIRRCEFCCCWRSASACRISCCRRPGRCCRPGLRGRFLEQYRIGCMRFRTVGSLLALLSYPFLFERLCDMPDQARIGRGDFCRMRFCAATQRLALWLTFRTEERGVESGVRSPKHGERRSNQNRNSGSDVTIG